MLLWIAVDSKDLFSTTLSTQLNSIDKSAFGDVCELRYEFLTDNVSQFTGVPGCKNLAYPCPIADGSLVKELKLLLANGQIPISFHDAEQCSNDRSLR